MECIRCGTSGDKTRLFDVVSSSGIEKMCMNCANYENRLILNKPTRAQLKESEKKEIGFVEGLKKFERRLVNPSPELEKQNTTLKKIVEENSEKKIIENFKPRQDLVDNFHWILMRSRRSKKLSQSELAKELGEAEITIKMSEKGILPEDDYKLVNKFESFFGISLIKKEYLGKAREKAPAKILSFDKIALKKITIDDLKKMKNSNEKNDFESVVNNKSKEKELSEQEIRDLLFRG
ncbi:MAG: hypothetical protein KJ566_00035 [Nanoarchaeota archaeon]|nr:hypothetical protein [Nanoarchaeota archaeon]